MALRRNSLALALLLATAAPAAAQDFNYLGRGDYIELSAGDARKANLAIQHPTPWPYYVNDTKIQTPSRLGLSALEKMFLRYEGGKGTSPSTVINIGSK